MATKSTIEKRRLKESRLETQRAEGARFLKAFGLQGGVWYAQGLSFKQARAQWNALVEEEAEGLAIRMGSHALAKFAAHMKVKKRRDAELSDTF